MSAQTFPAPPAGPGIWLQVLGYLGPPTASQRQGTHGRRAGGAGDGPVLVPLGPLPAEHGGQQCTACRAGASCSHGPATCQHTSHPLSQAQRLGEPRHQSGSQPVTSGRRGSGDDATGRSETAQGVSTSHPTALLGDCGFAPTGHRPGSSTEGGQELSPDPGRAVAGPGVQGGQCHTRVHGLLPKHGPSRVCSGPSVQPGGRGPPRPCPRRAGRGHHRRCGGLPEGSRAPARSRRSHAASGAATLTTWQSRRAGTRACGRSTPGCRGRPTGS